MNNVQRLEGGRLQCIEIPERCYKSLKRIMPGPIIYGEQDSSSSKSRGTNIAAAPHRAVCAG